MELLTQGLLTADSAMALNRAAIGGFFAISGYHKLTNADRHASLVATLKECRVPCLSVMQWFVPGVELSAGLGVASGTLTHIAALGLMVICLVAVCTDGLRRVAAWKPIDKADWVDDVLYLPEVTYLVMLAVLMATGPGRYSLDAVLF